MPGGLVVCALRSFPHGRILGVDVLLGYDYMSNFMYVGVLRFTNSYKLRWGRRGVVVFWERACALISAWHAKEKFFAPKSKYVGIDAGERRLYSWHKRQPRAGACVKYATQACIYFPGRIIRGSISGAAAQHAYVAHGASSSAFTAITQ